MVSSHTNRQMQHSRVCPHRRIRNGVAAKFDDPDALLAILRKLRDEFHINKLQTFMCDNVASRMYTNEFRSAMDILCKRLGPDTVTQIARCTDIFTIENASKVVDNWPSTTKRFDKCKFVNNLLSRKRKRT